MTKRLNKQVEKGRVTKEDVDGLVSRMESSTNMEDLKKADIIIEAATENLALKTTIFEKIDSIAKPGDYKYFFYIYHKIASATKRPESVVGMHFMNPVPVMKGVELIRGLKTSDETYEETKALAEAMGKTTTLAKDMPGFIANRILMPYINEACFALQEGIGSCEDIDVTMKLGTGVPPMGPLTLADLIGLDTCLSILQVLHTEFGDSKYRPSPILVKHVEAGWLGKKTGRGFYDYSK
eukprot:CAMPEP_0168538486 /NCGR_PEP_ID=MMETSP0405-20121227/21144_1 /TAXON_ID=498012 /ORGANISM="Trichosphaerium sp, Strain Am-I-7 wt" /LENGTH=237 /DNA_ID=CAMNT_0008567633 /DNA_START=55 /DNA_END=769 /DNA_ORIENTATION=+